jgi:uncharacterized protein YndB with AHSA1/START domain
MIRTTRSVFIEAPVAEVFTFMKDPRNWWEAAPSYMEFDLRDLEVAPDGAGTKYRFTGAIRGVAAVTDVTGEFLEVVENRRIVYRETGNFAGTFTWFFESVGAGTVVTALDEREEARIEQVPLIGRLAEWVLYENETHWLHLFKLALEKEQDPGAQG